MDTQTVDSKDIERFYAHGVAPFILASRLASYPAQEVRQDLLALLAQDAFNFACAEATDLALWKELRTRLMQACAELQTWDELAARYIDIFDRRAVENSLYETGYGVRGLQVKTTELADISGFYKAFGFGLSESCEQLEMPDHLAVECEFYALLIAKEVHALGQGALESAEIVLDARKKFLQDHLGRYPQAIVKRPGVSADPFYSVALKWCAGLISGECRRLDVGIVPADYRLSGQEEDQISCAASGDIVSRIGDVRKMS